MTEVKAAGGNRLCLKASRTKGVTLQSKLLPTDLSIAESVAIFRALKPEAIRSILSPATRVALKSHETLFSQGDPATDLFIVIDGWIKLFRATPAGDEAVIHVFTKGDSFAEAVAFTEGVYPATAEAVSDACVIRIPANHIVRCIRENPDIALAMIASTSQHLHHLVAQVEQLKAQSGVQRVAEFLVSLCSVKQGSCVVALPYDKSLIAARIGLKPESLSRAFSKLKAIGLTVKASHVGIKDVARLRQLARNDRETAQGVLRQRVAALKASAGTSL